MGYVGGYAILRPVIHLPLPTLLLFASSSTFHRSIWVILVTSQLQIFPHIAHLMTAFIQKRNISYNIANGKKVAKYCVINYIPACLDV